MFHFLIGDQSQQVLDFIFMVQIILKLQSVPDRPFHNFRAPRLGDWRKLCSSGINVVRRTLRLQSKVVEGCQTKSRLYYSYMYITKHKLVPLQLRVICVS